MKKLPKRKPIRLKNYDYSNNGYYFITICTQNRECLFGNIVDGKMKLNNVGKMINKWYLKIPKRFKNITLDEYQIMPNHLHGIIVIENNGSTHRLTPTDRISTPVGADPCVRPQSANPCVRPNECVCPNKCVNPNKRKQQTLFKTIQWFKTMTTNNYIRNVKNNNWKPFNKRIWQRSYYEHIIRNEKSLTKIRVYIANNPLKWDDDRNNPKNIKK